MHKNPHYIMDKYRTTCLINFLPNLKQLMASCFSLQTWYLIHFYSSTYSYSYLINIKSFFKP